ncbi:MAG: hypothetical protein ACYTDY_18300 [Planctomycetota bacterium]|jgi:hypothetical protein
MSLADKLDAIRAGFEKQAPPEALEVIHRATDDLRESGILERALGVGAQAPEFELRDTTGALVLSRDLLGRGPLVLTFFRGKW